MGVLVSEERGRFVALPEKLGASFRFSRAWTLGLEFILGVFDLVWPSGGRTLVRELSELFGFACGVCDFRRSGFEGFGRSVFTKRCFRSGDGDRRCSGVPKSCRLGFCLQVTWNSFNTGD